MIEPLLKPSPRKKQSRVIDKGYGRREVLNDADWQKRKHEIRLEQDDKCASCGAAHPTDLHHLNARGLGGGKRNDLRENLELLCRKCHQQKDHKVLNWSQKGNQ